MSDGFTQQPTKRQPSQRDLLWAELERLHSALGLPYPTKTLTIEELAARVEALKQEAGEA